ncbi:MAG TPA: SRPBCC family protein [Jiangellaceae bacterium]|nr:SRPBCC family protein [Jiangellaceae bacterium]
MSIDVTVKRVIPLPPREVARFAMDYRHDHEWTQGIRTAHLTRPAAEGGLGVGAQVTRTAYFLGKRIDYVLEIASFEPPTLLDMVSVIAPMPMHVTYRFDAHPNGTSASIRVRGGGNGFYRLAAPLLSWQVRRNLRKDLRDLQLRLTASA